MEKELYVKFSDGNELDNIIITTHDMRYLIEDLSKQAEQDGIEIKFTITPIWLTEKEFKLYPEANF